MSSEAIGWAWAQVLDPSQKIVLLALAHASDADGRCWLAKRDLADLTGLSKRSIANILRVLSCDGNIVSRERRCGPDGSCISNAYQLHIRIPGVSGGAR